MKITFLENVRRTWTTEAWAGQQEKRKARLFAAPLSKKEMGKEVYF